MKNKVIKKISLIIFSLLFCFLTYKFCYFIAEKYFFDKFIYRKSITHGYHSGNKLLKLLPFFGDRNKDIIALKTGQKIFNSPKFDKYYKIAIIGDSYVWGTGIKNNQRFSYLLEKKLNQIKPTKIITTGEPGNGTLDYLRWYNQISNNNINLYVFSLVGNDIYVDFPSYNFESLDYQDIISNCQLSNSSIAPISLIRSIDTYKTEDQGYSTTQISSFVYNLQLEAWKNPTNICVAKKALSLLPSNKSIYFFPNDYFGNNIGDPDYTQLLNITNKEILSSLLGQNIAKYNHFWLEDTIWQNSEISQKEKHPNALANQLYADLLYQEITTNPKWGFIK